MTPHISEEQLYREFFQQEQALQNQPNPSIAGGPPPIPQIPQAQKIVLGGQQFEYKSPEELQTLIQRHETVLQANLRTQMEGQGQQPVVNTPSVNTGNAPQSPAQRQNFDFDKYEKEFKISPARATDLALGAQMGAPDGVGASEYFKVLGTVVQQQATELQNLRTEQAQMTETVQRNGLATEIGMFHRTHPEFVQNRENAAILEETRNKYSLPMSAVGYDAALKLAQADRAPLQLQQGQSQPQYNNQPNYAPQYPATQPWGQSPAPRQVGLPSIGNSAGSPSHGNPQEDAMMRYLNGLPTGQWEQAIDRFEGKLK